VTEIAVYIEGGGNGKEQKAELRRGFDALFAEEKTKVARRRGSLKFVCCGGRQEAYEAFTNSLHVNSTVISALLVDSETAMPPVPANRTDDGRVRVAHLRQKEGTDGRGQGDGWKLPDDLAPRVHLMVQCMEAWIVADPDNLEQFYKQKFKRNSLPKRGNLEEEAKADVYEKLKSATKDTQKGTYGKIDHASKLLETIDPNKISEHCPRFVIFRSWLNETIG
jgi:hypothetical protein